MNTPTDTTEAGQNNEQGLDTQGLKGLRTAINEIDEEIIELLAKRKDLTFEVIENKKRDNKQIRDISREKEMLIERVANGQSRGLESHYVTRIFHEIIDDSVRAQQRSLIEDSKVALPTKIAFHGIDGSYCKLAGKKYCNGWRKGAETEFIGFPSFVEVANAVSNGNCDAAILPVENTNSGGISEVFDHLVNAQLSIIGEEKFRIDHHLLSIGTQKSELTTIYCSFLAYNDCKQFIRNTFPTCKIVHLSDSAECARFVSESNDPTIAAIASNEAGNLYGLRSLVNNISDNKENFIRYLLVASKEVPIDLKIPCKTSLILAVSQQPGALADALFVFKRHGINMTKLENRPVKGNPWEEQFYIDFEGNKQDEQVALALKELASQAKFMRVLGSYPANDLSRTLIRKKQISQQPQSPENCASKEVAPKKGKKITYTLASREHKAEDTIITLGDTRIGGDAFIVMAGPCSVESEDQIESCAQHASENGAVILRGGCFKPRTSPYSFQGLEYEGLDLLKSAGSRYNLPIITEVMDTEDVSRVAEKADILQIGARNMQNFTLLKAVGREQRPVMLKRGMSSSIEDLLNAAEYVLSQGNLQVILCERGIRTFETATRSTLDISAVPVLKERTHLPIIIDPSHAAGVRSLVPPLAKAAKAVGAHGIIVEFHPNPEEALSDGPQALRFPQFTTLMGELLS